MNRELFIKFVANGNIAIIINLKSITSIRKTLDGKSIRFYYMNEDNDVLNFGSIESRDDVFSKIWILLNNSNHEITENVYNFNFANSQ
jgi:hypothetical protein